MISSFSFGDESLGNRSAVTIENNKLEINYPCSSSTKCTYVEFSLNKGIYFFELFGANGGIAQKFFIPGVQAKTDSPGSGGYVSAYIILRKKSKFFAFLGGKGHSTTDGQVREGGYNGGGGVLDAYSSTGGGATDIRAQKSDPFHRIIVAGGGGASDDFDKETLEKNEGNGGAGGGLVSQSFTVSSALVEGYESTQTKGYSFFQGETGKRSGTSSPTGYKSTCLGYELPGGGGGWFGGYTSNHCNGGASGGSSFALSLKSEIPEGIIKIYNKDYIEESSGKYAFSPLKSPYLFYDIEHKRGIWNGDGKIIIKKVGSSIYDYLCTRSLYKNTINFRITLVILISR